MKRSILGREAAIARLEGKSLRVDHHETSWGPNDSSTTKWSELFKFGPHGEILAHQSFAHYSRGWSAGDPAYGTKSSSYEYGEEHPPLPEADIVIKETPRPDLCNCWQDGAQGGDTEGHYCGFEYQGISHWDLLALDWEDVKGAGWRHLVHTSTRPIVITPAGVIDRNGRAPFQKEKGHLVPWSQQGLVLETLQKDGHSFEAVIEAGYGDYLANRIDRHAEENGNIVSLYLFVEEVPSASNQGVEGEGAWGDPSVIHFRHDTCRGKYVLAEKRFLVVTCATKRTRHMIPVPPGMTSSREALAWTFDVPANQYALMSAS